MNYRNSDRLLGKGATGSSYFVCLADWSLFKLVSKVDGIFGVAHGPDTRSGVASFAYSMVADCL
jgi:hypothetical protein